MMACRAMALSSAQLARSSDGIPSMHEEHCQAVYCSSSSSSFASPGSHHLSIRYHTKHSNNTVVLAAQPARSTTVLQREASTISPTASSSATSTARSPSQQLLAPALTRPPPPPPTHETLRTPAVEEEEQLEHCVQHEPQRKIDWNTRLLFSRAAKTPQGGVKDVDKDTFWPTVKAAGDKLVVVDVYSRWCGPCRLIYPKLVNLSDSYTDVVFLKLDCVPENKPLTSSLGVGILPTFKILKGSQIVSEVKGAKYDELVQKIEKARLVTS